mmetsp:Transcript_13930/g.24884  ORF Transcript_13930/g.24884 Transcript_13930/m.24884 type:complete len:216 (-) Transcript_13930:464-1111(-)
MRCTLRDLPISDLFSLKTCSTRGMPGGTFTGCITLQVMPALLGSEKKSPFWIFSMVGFSKSEMYTVTPGIFSSANASIFSLSLNRRPEPAISATTRLLSAAMAGDVMWGEKPKNKASRASGARAVPTPRAMATRSEAMVRRSDDCSSSLPLSSSSSSLAPQSMSLAMRGPWGSSFTENCPYGGKSPSPKFFWPLIGARASPSAAGWACALQWPAK